MVGLCSLRDVVVELKRLKSQPSDQQEVEGTIALHSIPIQIESEERIRCAQTGAVLRVLTHDLGQDQEPRMVDAPLQPWMLQVFPEMKRRCNLKREKCVSLNCPQDQL